jgi:hypothetical protein
MPNQITCITKPNRDSAHEHITRVGGLNPQRQHFNISREEVIAYIKKGTTFHVKVGGFDVPVLIESRNGVEYIKTKPDWTKKDNLLSLPECP